MSKFLRRSLSLRSVAAAASLYIHDTHLCHVVKVTMNPNQGVLVMHICIDLLFNYLKDSLIKQYYVHPVGRYTVLLLQTPSGGYDNNMQWASQQRVLETEFPAPVLRVDIISYICIGSTCCLFNGKQIARSGVSIHVSSCTSSKKSIAPSV